uniref:Uncharacterized protein n=1 Tax=viral metagenome TaxID=1070528 RepID=A0A6C0C817_9ZZZZ
MQIPESIGQYGNLERLEIDMLALPMGLEQRLVNCSIAQFLP